MVLGSDKAFRKVAVSLPCCKCLGCKINEASVAFLKRSHCNLNLITDGSSHNPRVDRDFSIVQYYC